MNGKYILGTAFIAILILFCISLRFEISGASACFFCAIFFLEEATCTLLYGSFKGNMSREGHKKLCFVLFAIFLTIGIASFIGYFR